MNVENLKIEKIKPYERNAKKHDETQIKNVMESIKQFGFAQPLVVDENNVLIIGHCRLLASKKQKARLKNRERRRSKPLRHMTDGKNDMMLTLLHGLEKTG